MMNVLGKATIGGAALSLALFALLASPSFAQTPPPPPPAGPASGGTPTHEQVHQMLDDMHGAGASQRMHEMMGPDADRMIDQWVTMQGMMQQMQAMMGDGGMAAMPDDRRQMMRDMMSMMQGMARMDLEMMGMMSSGMIPMSVMRDHQGTMQSMMQQRMDMMQQMIAMMISGTMTPDMMRGHQAAMQRMMQQMMGMMEGMQPGGRPGPAPVPAQIPRR